MITIIRKSILLFMGLIIIYSLVLFFRNDDANSINRFLIDSDSTFLNNNKIASILKDRIKDRSLFEIEPLAQDKTKEIRYTKKVDFNEQVVNEYLNKKININSKNFDLSLLKNPFFLD